MPNYRLAPAASGDIAGIFLEGLAQFGLEQADRYHEGLTSTFEFLAEYPRAARLREEIDPPVRAYPYRSHVIVYELGAGDMVIILGVRHAREDWMPDVN
ncbi:type II toxin-antitoxin system RelE/ParE family toxin [Sphingomonas sp. RT2P30]|uniref:type II toxin-antitoxin system RelE/ParE family toxin n=1 Tax=Parasphingomonas halimpatiens TaxID=3096162 RepID=UPI002FC786ED